MLKIRLLGQFDVQRDGEPLKIPSRPSRLLFAYLALTAGKHHPRERLAGLLWPESDEDSARGNLRQALWRLRKVIGDSCLLVDNRTVAFDPETGYWLDTAVLDDRSDWIATNERPVALEIRATKRPKCYAPLIDFDDMRVS